MLFTATHLNYMDTESLKQETLILLLLFSIKQADMIIHENRDFNNMINKINIIDYIELSIQ